MTDKDKKSLLEICKDFKYCKDVYEIDSKIAYLRRLYRVIYAYRRNIKDEVICQVINDYLTTINDLYGTKFLCVFADEYENEINNVINFLNNKAAEICLKLMVEKLKDEEKD